MILIRAVKHASGICRGIMKNIYLALGLFLLFSYSGYSQESESWPPLRQLRDDYRHAAVVAHVKFQKAETVDALGGYVTHRVYCEVIEPFKGSIRKGQPLEFYTMADKQYKLEWYSGEKIIFLEKFYAVRNKKWSFSELENSWVDPTRAVVAKMRRISSPKRRR
jgi:hypothetical protein